MRTTVARLLAVAVLACGIVVALALPAAAHATALSVEPQPGGVYDSSPPAVIIRFDEPVETSLGGIRVFDGQGNRIDVGRPTHPDGSGSEVQASLPDLDNGTYVVTWRVISADSHPVEGAFSFQVGPNATVSNAGGLAARLLARQGGSTAVGVVYAIDRALLYAALALLIGGGLFLAVLFPEGRGTRRPRHILWTGWGALVATTVAGIALEGVYAAALPLTKVFDPTVWSDVLDTRYGKIALLRLGLLALAFPLVQMLVHRDRTLPRWWAGAAAVVSVALASTPGLSGHASTGNWVGLALVSDTIHVLAMACWIGGLVMLVGVVLVQPLPDGLPRAVTRFSGIALGAITALLVTGGFQAWRQIGTLDELRNTDFGRLVLAKLVVFAAIVVAAAFSREVVNRTFYDDTRVDDADVDDTDVDDEEDETERVGALVGASDAVPSRAVGGDGITPALDVGGIDDDDRDEEWVTDESEARRLRRSVIMEVVFAVVVLAISSVLVNTAPARTVSTAPVSFTMRSGTVFADVTIAPGNAGRNDIHFTALTTSGKTIEDVQMQLTRPDGHFAPFDVPLRDLGPGHYYAPQFDIPYSGDWTMVARVRLGATDEVVLTKGFSLR
jgi:copper transport protein